MSLCECGCGGETKLYRGKPNRFISGHQGHINKGKPQTEQHRKNRSLATKGIVNKGKIPWNKGKTGLGSWNRGVRGCFSEETLKQMSISMKGKCSGNKNGMYGVHRFGENNPAWKGGTKLSTLRKNTKRRELGFEQLNESFLNRKHII